MNHYRVYCRFITRNKGVKEMLKSVCLVSNSDYEKATRHFGL